MASQTKKKPRPKVVAVIIEGESEYSGLQYQLEEFFDSFDLVPLFCLLYKKDEDPGGDITANDSVNPDNIEQKISRYLICPSLRINGLKETDIISVVQIVDTDGAFIPDDCIEEVRQLAHPEEKKSLEYYSDVIKALNKNNACIRNRIKTANLKALAGKETVDLFCYTQAQIDTDDSKTIPLRYQNQIPDTPKVKSVPYYVFFYSCNFDHFICGERNLPRADKTKKADDFSTRVAPDLEALKKHFTKHPGTLKGKTYRETWEFIEKDINSLQQHTNLHLLLEMEAEAFYGTEDE